MGHGGLKATGAVKNSWNRRTMPLQNGQNSILALDCFSMGLNIAQTGRGHRGPKDKLNGESK